MKASKPEIQPVPNPLLGGFGFSVLGSSRNGPETVFGSMSLKQKYGRFVGSMHQIVARSPFGQST
jgi:hypothetical protein